MIPSPWEFVLLSLAAYRLTRLGGWDEFPLAAKVRAWVIGEEWIATVEVPRESQFPQPTMEEIGKSDVSLPGKTPESAIDDVRPAYRRPTLAHLVHCPFCLGWWVSLACFVAWLLAGDAALVVLVPFAISGVVGLIAKNLDP